MTSEVMPELWDSITQWSQATGNPEELEENIRAYARAYAEQEVAKEREACAKVADENDTQDGFMVAEYIRARSKQ